MADLKLPEINPIEVDRQAGVWDIAGNRVNQALQQIAEVPAGLDKARTIVQTNEALIKRKEEINARVYKVLDENPTLQPDQIGELFGYEVPLEVQKAIYRADGGPVPNYMVGPHLLSHVEKQATERAARGIEGSGWQERFSQHVGMQAVAEQEQFRNQMSNLEQNVLTQKMVDAYEAARNNKDPVGMEAAMIATPNPLIRTKLEDRIRGDVQAIEIEKMFTTSGPLEVQLAQVQKGRRAVQLGAFGYRGPTDPNAPPETPDQVAARESLDKFKVALSPAEKGAWLKLADEKEKDIREAMYRQITAPIEQALVKILAAPPYERRALALDSTLYQQVIDPRLTLKDAEKYKEIVAAFADGKDIPFDYELFGTLVRNGDEVLRGMTYKQVTELWKNFPPKLHQELMDRWGKLDKGSSVDDWLDARTSKWIDVALEEYKLDPKHAMSPQQHARIWGELAQDVIALRRARGRDYFVTMPDIAEMADRRLRGAPKSNIGDTGFRDMDEGEATFATGAMRRMGIPWTADSQRQFVLKARGQTGTIEAAWDRWAPKDESLTPGRIVQMYGMAQDPRTRAKYEDIYRQYHGAKGDTPPPLSDAVLYGMLAATISNTDSKALHPAIRKALETERERSGLGATYDADAAARAAADVIPGTATIPGTGAEARQPSETPEAWRARRAQEREAQLAAENEANKAAAAKAAADKAARLAAEAEAKRIKDAEMEQAWREREAKANKNPWERPLPGVK